MGGGAGQHGSPATATGVRPGALSALLEEIVRAPETDRGDGWEQQLRPGLSVGKFELVRVIGSGGFGVVWEARDRELGRRVAFKAVRAGRRMAVREERLLLEAEAAARLSHPNIVTLYDLGRSEQGPYLVLELLQGETLEERLSQGKLSLREVMRIATEVAKGVAHAHAQGVVHRDLKPSNVFLCEDGQVKVLDFGLAHAFGHMVQDGGTPAYMAPEQREGAPEDERTDVFAMGVLLYRMLSGELPSPSEGMKALLGSMAAPALEVPELPGLGALTVRMLQRRPIDRPRHGGEVVAALQALQRDLVRTPSNGTAPPVVRVHALPRWARQALLLAGLAASAAALGFAWRHFLGGAGRDPGVGERPIVVVADIANETGERELDALSGLFITALEQSRQLAVLPRGRLFDVARQAGHSDAPRIDEVIGREVGRKVGARALIVTSVHRLGATYAVQLRALDPATDEGLFAARESASSKEAIFGLLDRLADRARAELRGAGAATGSSGVRPTASLTTSLEAYEHYFRGLERMDRFESLRTAEAEFRKALEKDPHFSMAHYALSVTVMSLGRSDEERREHAVAAARGADQLPERERLLVQAWHARTFWKFEEMGRLYWAFLERYPDDKRSLMTAAAGMYVGLSDAEFVRQASEKVLAIDPAHVEARGNFVDALVLGERLDDALQEAQRWERESHAVEASEWLGLIHVMRGEPDEALGSILAASAVPGRSEEDQVWLRFLRARVRMRRDELEEAEADVRSVPPEKLGRYDYTFRAVLAVQRGRPRESERLLAEAGVPFEQAVLRTRLEMLAAGGPSLALRAAARAMSAQSGTVDGVVAAVLALGGEVDLAAEVARRPNAHHSRSFVEAMRLRHAGELAGARRALEELRHGRPGFVRLAATFALGELCQAAGDDRCAVEALQAFRWMDDPVWRFESRAWAYPRSLLLLARSQERLGDRRAARAAVDQLLALWKDAEPDFAPLSEARALRASLSGPAAEPPRPQ